MDEGIHREPGREIPCLGAVSWTGDCLTFSTAHLSSPDVFFFFWGGVEVVERKVTFNGNTSNLGWWTQHPPQTTSELLDRESI